MSKKERKVACFVCENVFPTKSKMLKHVSEMHQISSDSVTSVNLNQDENKVINEFITSSGECQSSNPEYSCDLCSKKFLYEKELHCHLQKKHNNVSYQNQRESLKCVMCEHNCFKKQQMRNHYEDVHGYKIVNECRKLQNFDQFLTWKRNLEQDTVSKFIKFRTKYFKNSTKHFYRCHRDGNFKTSGKQMRHLKVSGSNKINGYCPAKIEVCLSKGKEDVIIKYITTHVGHDKEIQRINLNSEEREFVASKLSNKTPCKRLLNDIKTAGDGKYERLKFLTMKDLHNIKKSYALVTSNISKENEYHRIQNLIEEIHTRDSSAIKIFKPVGTIMVDYPSLSVEDILLVLATDEQLNKLQHFGNNIVCIDVHHSDNHDYDIISLSIIDEKSHCFPCGFLFSNKMSKSICILFFEAIKTCLGFPLQSRAIMCDIDEVYHIWCDIMGYTSVHLYSLWLLKDNWRENIQSKIHSLIKQEHVFAMLRELTEKRECSDFEKSLDDMINKMHADYELATFCDYFESFKNNRKSWAQCYREPADIASSIHFERLHCSVKFLYSQERKLKFIDGVVLSLISFLEHKFLSNGSSCHETMKRHEICLKTMASFSVSDNGDNSWTVTCTKKNASFKITRGVLSCSCDDRCNECNICSHSYICSCDDSYIKWNICQHIHLICQFIHSETDVIPVNIQNNEVFIYQSLSGNDSNVANEIEIAFTEDLEDEKSKLVEQFKSLVESVCTVNELNILKDYLKPISSKLKLIKEQKILL